MDQIFARVKHLPVDAELFRGGIPLTVAMQLSGTPSWEEDLTFDPTGNWNNYVTKARGSTTLNQNRTHNNANEILTIAVKSLEKDRNCLNRTHA